MKWTPMACLASMLLGVAGCGPVAPAPPEKKTEAEVRASFAALQRALSRGDREAVIGHLSPATMAIFEAARVFGTDPDGTDTESLSQASVLLGFQARWMLGAADLESKTTADLFGWCVEKDIVPLRSLGTVDLHDVKVDGDRATAHMEQNGATLTNTVLSFRRHGGTWKFDFHRILGASEPELFALRAQRGLGKAETAVLMLEGMYGQPIPALRELLLTPKLRQQIAALREAKPSEVYDAVLGELSAGRQRDAEGILEVGVGIHTNDQRLAFAQAACTRSRFNTEKADRQFRRVFEMNPGTVEGNCARYLLDLDDQRRVDDSFKGLRLLAAQNPENPLIHWMIGVACRDYHRHTDRTDRSAEGAEAYARVLEIFDEAPVLVHQTYANILDEELDRHEEALPHRRIAVSMEPKAWTYQGLANTLMNMGRYGEADEAFAKLIELAPDDAEYWHNWAVNFSRLERWSECAARCEHALKLDAGFVAARNTLGFALEEQGKLREALAQYEEAIRLDPVHPYAYEAAARVLAELGEKDKAQEFLRRKARMDGAGQPEQKPPPPASQDPANP